VAYLHADTGSSISISGSHMLAGAAIKRSGTDASFLFGAFFEAAFASYDASGAFGPAGRREHLTADGDLEMYGGGVMARLRGKNGLRLEGSLRAGTIENDFTSNLTDVDGTRAEYDITVPYLAAHAGVGYEWKINDTSTLDFLARYYWARQWGTTDALPTGERVHFEADDSHRLRGGARYTYAYDERRFFYAGAALEHEFANRVKADAGYGTFDIPDLRGTIGVGELGLIIYPGDSDSLAIECGVQGYVGKLSGISGGIRMGWQF
jgi:hypothetical protein